MDHSAEMLRCLKTVDVDGIRRLWSNVSPNMPQPHDDSSALVAIHHARTQCRAIAFRDRAYSHRWLTDNGYPSGLPDELRPKAEQTYHTVVQGVGISCNARSELFKPIVKLVQRSMEDAVSEAFADGKTDPEHVSARMSEARADTVRLLLGKVT